MTAIRNTTTLDRPDVLCAGRADDRPRRDDRERRPAVDPGRHGLLPVQPGVGRERVHRSRSVVCCSWPGASATCWATARVPRRPRVFTSASVALRPLAERSDADRRPLSSREFGGALSSAVVLGNDRDVVPEPREQAKAIGRLRLVASAGGSIGLLAGGILTVRDQQALDLLHSCPDRDSPRRFSNSGWSRTGPASAGRRARTCQSGRSHHRPDDRRCTRSPGLRAGLGLVAGPRPVGGFVGTGRKASSCVRRGSRTR